MAIIAALLVAVMAAGQLYFMYVEMFLWTKPSTAKSFGISLEEAKASQKMASNQGLYNGLFAAGLIWGLLHPESAQGEHIQMLFLLMIAIAGIFGGMTVKRSIFMVQGLPALVALAVVLIA